jgi:hypothetical protein
MDGVVHLHVTPLDGLGRPYTNNAGTSIEAFIPSQYVPVEERRIYGFKQEALPAMVQLELAVLEPQTYEQLKPMINNQVAAEDFLKSHGGKVHIFRQQIPIRPARQ